MFSKDVSSLGIYLGDGMSTNRVPWVFCALHRRCSNYESVSPAYVEGEKYIEREWYCERKSEIEVFKVNRNYEEFIERLDGERSNNNNEYLPYSETEIATIVDDDNNDNNYLPCEITGVVVDNYDDDSNDCITYLIRTDNTNGDRTIPLSLIHI